MCRTLAEEADSSFALISSLSDLLRITPAAFLQTSDVIPAFLAAAIRYRRRDLCDLLAQANQSSIVEFLIYNAASVFAPLLLDGGQILAEATRFASDLLIEHKARYGLQELMTADYAALILSLAMRSNLDEANREQVRPHRLKRL